MQGYSYWTFSDIFEENYFSSVPFHGGFGLMTIQGIPKPVYRAYELLHRMDKEILTVQGAHPTVDVWITKGPGVLHILITNSALPRHPVKTEAVRIQLNGPIIIKGACIERIDDTHANARGAWEAMGKPGYLSFAQVAQLEATSSLIRELLATTSDNGSLLKSNYWRLL